MDSMANVKVIIRNGVVESVLSTDTDVNVEIIDVCDGYEDCEWLYDYAEKAYHDATLKNVSFTVAHEDDSE